jgi:hypothetical protein
MTNGSQALTSLFLTFCLQIYFVKSRKIKSTYKVRNEIETKRNQRNENEIKLNQRKQNEINENGSQALASLFLTFCLQIYFQ